MKTHGWCVVNDHLNVERAVVSAFCRAARSRGYIHRVHPEQSRKGRINDGGFGYLDGVGSSGLKAWDLGLGAATHLTVAVSVIFVMTTVVTGPVVVFIAHGSRTVCCCSCRSGTRRVDLPLPRVPLRL